MVSQSSSKSSKLHRTRDSLRSGWDQFKGIFKPTPHPSPRNLEAQLASSATPSRHGSPSPGSQQASAAIKPASPASCGPTALNTIKETRNTAWTGLETALRILEKSADGFPLLKSTIGEFVQCLDVVQAAAENSEGFEELASELETIATTLGQYVDELGSEDPSGSIANIISSINKEVEHIKKKQARGKLKRILESTEDKEDVVQSYRRVEVSFRQLQNNAGLWTLRKLNKQHEMTLLQGMSPEEDARYNSNYSTTIKRHGCTAETREKVQADLQAWVQDPNAAKVYWMNGMAGTGKTTIAYSLCEWLEANKQLGANFFCSRAKDSCRDASRIVPTIACQLARYSPAFRSSLCRVLESDPGISKLNVVQQFERLVKTPLLETTTAIPNGVVVVIDALDECEENHGVRLVLATLIRFTTVLPIKFFVASRPEPVIRDKMLSSSDYSPFVLRLHDIEESIVGEDIKKYLNDALSSMSPPPSNDQIERLAKRAGKLFIYASTVVRYIFPSDIPVDSNARLLTMLAIDSALASEDEGSTKYDELDQLYTTILTVAFDKRLERREVANRLLVLHTVVCAREPMTIETLALLLGITKAQVSLALQPLQSVLRISEGDGLVSTLHASFPDYVLDHSRSGKLRWYCNSPQHSERIAQGCFSVMEDQLRFNICGLESSFVFDADIPDLQERVQSAISPALFYSCRYWSEHLQPAAISSTLFTQLVEFLSYRLLFWMEVLNLKQHMLAGVTILQGAQDWLLTNSTQDTAQIYAADALNFVTRFVAGACTRSTPHIYISALPLCPKSSSVYEHYWPRTKGLLDANGTALSRREHAAIATWRMNSGTNTVAVSPDGTRIVSGSYDPTIRVWDARTGYLVAGLFEGHTTAIASVAFSPDGIRIVSGSCDHTIRVWDARTGDLVAGPFEGHTNSVYSVAFSSDSIHVVSGSEDCTIRVWDARTGDLVAAPFKGHTARVNSVAFSPDSTRIVSGSDDCTIRVWDARTGDLVARPFEGNTDPVNSVAFSPDDTRIVSGSRDHTVRVWDAHAGDLVRTCIGHTSSISSAAFSPDSTRVVSGSEDWTIRVWDARTGNLVAGPFRGHTDSVNSVAFSPDGTRIVSGSKDKTIRVWNIRTGDSAAAPFEGYTHSAVKLVMLSPDGTRIASSSEGCAIQVWDARTGDLVATPFKGHTDLIYSAAFSPNSTRIVSGSDDCTLRVWDARTGDLVVGPFEGHTARVSSVAFSPDGTHIVSGSSDCTIRVWDARTGDLVATPFKGHTDSVVSVVFSPDGTHIVSGSDDWAIRVWVASTGDPVAAPFIGHTGTVNSVAFSPDSTRIVSGSRDRTVRVWDVHNGDLVAGPLEGHTNSVSSVAFSPDGTCILSGSQDNTIRVWDMRTGDLITAPFESHITWVNSVVLSPGGARAISRSTDRTIRVFNTQTSAIEHELSEKHAGSIRTTHAQWTLADDGWIQASDIPFIWISPDIQSIFPYPPHTLMIGPQGAIWVDNWDILLGERWSQCYLSS